MTGNWGGLRTDLENRGITLSGSEVSEVLGNTSGGFRRTAWYEGKTTLGAVLDLDKLVGWRGATISINGYHLHGHGVSTKNLGNLMTVSNIESARHGFLLNDLFLDQKLVEDKLAVAIGQFAADEEFMISDLGANFVNGTFGAPSIFGVDLPNGGPAFPYATPGIRVAYTPTPPLTLRAALFNGDPFGGSRNDDRHGTAFSVGHGAFAIAEAAYAITPGKDEPGLPAAYKFGGWYNSKRFENLRRDRQGLSLVDPASTGLARKESGTFALYVMADQMIWRKPGTEDGGLGVFGRFFAAPQQNRNPITYYVDGGVTYKGPFPGRDSDIVGVGFGYSKVSNALRDLDRDAIRFAGISQPLQSHETLIEVTYIARLAPWLAIQPDFQYVFNPGGRVPDPDNPSRAEPDAAIFGVRASITF